MRKNLANIMSITTILLSTSCIQEDLPLPPALDQNINLSSQQRLNFPNETVLRGAIANNQSEKKGYTKAEFKNFTSLLDPIPNQMTTSYYEALGYDSLVPNVHFAALLSAEGEVEVGTDIIKITPKGTFKYHKSFEDNAKKYINSTETIEGVEIEEGVYQINENLTFYDTFRENESDYTLLSNAAYDEIEDSDPLTKSSSEPDFSKFETFSADRTTFVGSLIQKLIGSTKTTTIKFNKKRRVRGSFYFYNYGVYSEIGVKGWTDKKNWIGWSKTNADELRVGWKNVVLKKTVDDYYKNSLNNLKETIYLTPESKYINGRKVSLATLVQPDFKPGFKDKLITQGSKAVFDFLKKELSRPQTEIEKIDAILVASRTELFYVTGTESEKKYNEDYYCHVFAKDWMEFEIGWNNQTGVFINGIHQNNKDKVGSWLSAIGRTFNQKRTNLVSGEVYICARFGNDWRGMKIIKRN